MGILQTPPTPGEYVRPLSSKFFQSYYIKYNEKASETFGFSNLSCALV